MKAKSSPLQLKDFSVFETKFDAIIPDEPVDIDFSNLPIQMDFDILQPENREDYSRLLNIEVKINAAKKHPGYSIYLRAGAIFDIIDHNKLEDKTIKNLLGISALSISISQVRGYLQNISSYGFCGPYLLPPIDINDLFEKKIKAEQEQ
ncbi:MAG: hypothetical protein ACOCVX_05460 [Bacteroidales bacterium]